MNILERIQSCLPALTNSERKVAEYIILAPIDVVRFPSEYLAQRSGGSRGAIIRLCQKLGYKGYSEFKYDMSKSWPIPYRLFCHAAGVSFKPPQYQQPLRNRSKHYGQLRMHCNERGYGSHHVHQRKPFLYPGLPGF
ncbi:MAG: MurR/RpiR family transcriptional regulator [Hungatella sp.]|nr:MurR/RpiR family transcriptional regulator [Hungatella sp.]